MSARPMSSTPLRLVNRTSDPPSSRVLGRWAGRASRAAAHPPRVLLVDPDNDVHAVVDIRLSADGMSVAHAFDGKSALDAAHVLLPDLVLLDSELGPMSGLEVCRALKHDPDLGNIPVMFLTPCDRAARARAFQAGAVDCMEKPLDVAELRARVQTALRSKRRSDLLSQLAHIDGLTGLDDRSAFEARLWEDVATVIKYRRTLAVALVDVDRLAELNDRHGHPFGDHVLCHIAEAVEGAVRPMDLVARYRGGQLAVLLRETDVAGAELAGEQIREEIAALALYDRGELVPVTASVGIACAEPLQRAGELTAVNLVAAANMALEKAKQLGKNRTVRG
jgi:diguanylate cyclase (GGDEF)-like protein